VDSFGKINNYLPHVVKWSQPIVVFTEHHHTKKKKEH